MGRLAWGGAGSFRVEDRIRDDGCSGVGGVDLGARTGSLSVPRTRKPSGTVTGTSADLRSDTTTFDGPVQPTAASSDAATVSGHGWVSTTAGSHLRGRRTKDTGPEVALRRAVHALGLRFRLNRRVLRCRPDFVLPASKVAVFVDGCYWHGCPTHGPVQFRGPNADRWRAKLRANADRDHANNAALREAGWRVVRVWECEVRQAVTEAALRVERVARSAVDESQTFLIGHAAQSDAS
ncbi:very short patch repair endonuclease [Micromonospora arida]|uniref:very short patch repair endonuclease n=1 Tax=Micromonospora arida TaxID=2203715 RepID=UPI003CEC4812